MARRVLIDAPAVRPGMGHNRNRLAVLDGLRLCAALGVMAYHFTGFEPGVRKAWGMPATSAFPGLSAVTSYGWLGVELFFLISGFVICMSCWGRDAGAFFRSRVTRLFPAYWAAVAVTFTVVALFSTEYERVSLPDALLNLTMMQRPLGAASVDGVYWTLWVEACFCFLFAAVVWHGLTLRRVTVFCYVWLIASVIAVPAKSPLFNAIVQPGWAPYFIAGIALYLIHRFGSDLKLWGLVGVCFAMAVHQVHGLAVQVGADDLHRPLSPVPAVLMMAVFFAVMSAVALGWLSWIRWRWLTTAGLLTYPLYLIHEFNGWVLIHALRGHFPRYVTLAVVTATVLAGAWLLHRLVERPVAGLLRRHLAPPTSLINQRRAADPRDEKPRPRVPEQTQDPEVTQPSA
jgi:peptidoglycan/LPS O-acetylase OafA/YrhL